MENLLCETEAFKSKIKEIETITSDYKSLVNKISKIGASINKDWKSTSGESFYELFFKNKEELDTLARNYDSLNALLKKVITTYEKIESNYS